MISAATRLSGGEILTVSREAASLGTAVGGRMWLMVLLALAVATFSFLAFQTSIDRTDGFIRKVLSVLTSFSEGRFDTRITGVAGDSVEETARFNEVLSRIQDSVYKNKARNQALSTVMNYMQNGILAVDEKLNVILVTPSAKKLLGIVGSIDDPVPSTRLPAMSSWTPLSGRRWDRTACTPPRWRCALAWAARTCPCGFT
jgi:nitrogen fixation/metabolism regulation signal transduction histidine kinase